MHECPVEIVLVEDNDYDRDLALHVLRRMDLTAGLKVLRDGVEAIEWFGCGEGSSTKDRPAHPRLVLLDLKLPRMDGLEVLARIKGCPATASIPVVAFTSSRHSSDIQAAYTLGVNSYVVKPVEFEEYSEALKATVLYWLNHNLDTVSVGVSE